MFDISSIVKKIIVALIINFLLLISAAIVVAEEVYTKPKKIIIPTADIQLDVNPAKIVLDTWEVRLDGASFGESSALPGQKGNTIIFSHALPDLFGNLTDIEVGDTINIFTELDWFVYKVTKKSVVEPENVEVLNQVYPHQLTLYTCVGDNYSKRFVITAELQANTSASFL